MVTHVCSNMLFDGPAAARQRLSGAFDRKNFIGGRLANPPMDGRVRGPATLL